MATGVRVKPSQRSDDSNFHETFSNFTMTSIALRLKTSSIREAEVTKIGRNMGLNMLINIRSRFNHRRQNIFGDIVMCLPTSTITEPTIHHTLHHST